MTEALRVAERGDEFEVTEPWLCHCGAEHRFGAYGAAHWGMRLTHTCPSCERVRVFKEGRCVRLDTPGSALSEAEG